MRLVLVLALSLGACSPDPAPLVGAALPERGDPLTLASTPLDHGVLTTLTSAGCDSASVVYFLMGTQGLGAGPCPAQLGGLCTDLVSPKDLGAVPCTNGAAGRAFQLPNKAPGGMEVDFQALSIAAGFPAEKSPPIQRFADAWWSSAVVDGDPADWDAGDEGFADTSAVGTNYVTWDGDALYVASNHPDVQYGGSQHWFTIYVGDGLGGSTTGVQFNTQQPGLPIPFQYQIRWKADNSYDSLMTWDGSAWVSTDYWLGTNGTAWAENDSLQTVEFAIPWASLGLQAPTVYVHLAWVYEGSGFESTYAGTPSTSFVDGYDPDYGDVLAIDRSSYLPPVLQNP